MQCIDVPCVLHSNELMLTPRNRNSKMRVAYAVQVGIVVSIHTSVQLDLGSIHNPLQKVSVLH